MRRKWRVIQTIFVLFFIVLGFVAFYAHEPVYVIPRTEFFGSSFVLTHTTNFISITYPSVGPLIQALGDTPTAPPTIYQYEAIGTSNSSLFSALSQTDLIINSAVVQNSLLYNYGSNPLNSYVNTRQLDHVYSSPMFDVFMTLSEP